VGKKHKTIFHGVYNVVKAEGVRGLYKGFSPTVVRESTYSTIRLGMYEPFKNKLGGTDPKNTPIHIKMAAGSLSGCIGAFLANPTDILKVRM
jgi:solute carrier family 25 (mitochondrial carrier), member 14/30